MTELNVIINGITISGNYRVEGNKYFVELEAPVSISDRIILAESESVKDYLMELLALIEIINSNKELFTKFYRAYKQYDNLLILQYYKRVFYSENERDAYISDMCDKLRIEYFRLYRELIAPRQFPTLRIAFPNPSLLKQILKLSDQNRLWKM